MFCSMVGVFMAITETLAIHSTKGGSFSIEEMTDVDTEACG